MNTKEIKNNRKALAITKGLVVGEDFKKYNKILTLYKEGFECLLSKKVKLSLIDQEINNCNLFFSPSNSMNRAYDNSKLGSNYIFCLNQYYVEKLSIVDINKLLMKDDVDREVLEIIKRTYKDVLYKDNAKSITYGFANLDNIVSNGTIVFKLVVGKNKKKLDHNEFMENLEKQDKFIEEISSKIIKKVKEELFLECRILHDRMI